MAPAYCASFLALSFTLSVKNKTGISYPKLSINFFKSKPVRTARKASDKKTYTSKV
jgi:hypothetical protein